MPNDIIHTICAFANDLHNVNGGYLVIGIRAEDGIPVLPPQGLPENRLDSIQQEIFQYCNLITPRYIPRIEVVNYENTGIYLIYLWCSAGDSGPYQAPVDVYAEKGKRKDKRMQYWIRPASLTVAADRDEIAELFDKFNSIPFDDRVNRRRRLRIFVVVIWKIFYETVRVHLWMRSIKVQCRIYCWLWKRPMKQIRA